jgi:hypothetical protein
MPFFQVRISLVLRFVSICDLFTDSPSYVKAKLPLHLINYAPCHEDVRESGYIIPSFLNTTINREEW